MNTILTSPWILILVAAVVAIAVATVRLVRTDRPANPPGTPNDWRNDQLIWSRVRIG